MSDDDLETIEVKIRELQKKADILRRVRKQPDCETAQVLHERYRGAHHTFMDALDQFESDLHGILEEVAALHGFGPDVDYREWLSLKPAIQPYLYDFDAVTNGFFTTTRSTLVSQIRHDVELLFLLISGYPPVGNWFQHILDEEERDADDEDEDENEA